MYEEFLETILIYIRALNAAEAEIAKLSEARGANSGLPGLDQIRVLFEGEHVGDLVDEIGGVWSYAEKAVT